MPARVLPPSDDPLRTWVAARGEWLGFQEFMIRERAQGPVEGVEVRGAAAAARRRREALDALAGARAIVIGPSNPVISIGPILAVPGIGEALRAAAGAGRRRLAARRAARCSRARPTRSWPGPGIRSSSDGIAAHYDGLLDGLVADERASGAADARDRRRDGRRRARARRVAERDARLRARRSPVASRPMRTVAVLPVKRFDSAKQRLGEAVGGPERRELAAAMVEDVLAALARSTGSTT